MSKPHENYALDQKRLDAGGYAEVFAARDKRTNARVALKRLLRNLRDNEDAIARMRREVEVQTALKHPNVMPILDHSDSYQWYTMPLANKVVGKLIPPVDDATLIEIVEACAHGLAAAHEKGYVHRDLTPNNILFIDDGVESRWVVSDWGLVRRLGQTTGVQTGTGQVLGTAGFAAPETWTDAHKVDRRADIYGLGRVVAWCLTGQWPVPNMPLLPEGKWREFVRLTTDLDQAQRPQDMAAVLELAAKIKAPSNIRAAVVTGVNPPPIESVKPLPGLAKIDTVLFKAMCEVSLQTGIDWINRSQLTDTRNELGISEEDLSDSIDIIGNKESHVFVLSRSGVSF